MGAHKRLGGEGKDRGREVCYNILGIRGGDVLDLPSSLLRSPYPFEQVAMRMYHPVSVGGV